MDRKPAQLSGGQRQRVAIGRALAREPEVFLFDEPLSNLDAMLRVQMRIELAKLHKTLGTTMIYVTHDQVEAMTLADRIVVLDRGVIAQIGAPLELYARPDNKFVASFIGSPTMNFLAVTPQGVDGRDITLAFDGPANLRGMLGVAARNALDGAGAEPADIGIRPEHVAITDPSDQRAQLDRRGAACRAARQSDDRLCVDAGRATRRRRQRRTRHPRRRHRRPGVRRIPHASVRPRRADRVSPVEAPSKSDIGCSVSRTEADEGLHMPTITRRDFLGGTALAIAAGLTPLDQLRADTARYYPPALTGLRGSHPGAFEVAHRLAREGEKFDFSGKPVEEEYDLVVVGGGISGLAAAGSTARRMATRRKS